MLAGCVAEKCGLGCKGDAKITAAVEARLNQHPEIGNLVTVQTLDHVVYLTGYVSAGEIGRTAEAVAQGTPGVTKVVNNISATK
jgi:osmotically-inducible protein OsmY